MGTQNMRELSLFSGGGGGILASHLLGWELKGCAEWDEGARAILQARIDDGSIPNVTLHKDVQQLDPTEYIGEVDIVTGGFPCQPFSNAGKKLGVDDPRNMWPHTVRILKGTEAPYGYFENVASLLGSGYFGTVLKDLIEAGFHVSWDCVPASAVGAPHIRDRLWIFARKAQEDDPTVEPGALPLLTVATLENGEWQRTTGNATWTETDDLGEPAKWPRAGVAIGKVAHAIPRSGFPKGVRKYGVWPMARLPWAPLTEDEETTVQSVWSTPMAANGSKSSYKWRAKHQNDLNAAVANPDKAGWPTPTVMDGLRVEQVRTPEQIEEARKGGGCRNLREEAVWATPTTMDTLPPKSQEVLDREATEARAGRSKAANLRDQVNVEAGNVDWKGKETFPTPTASERSGVNPNTGRGGGLTHEIKQRDMYPTPLAGENRKSAKSLKRIEEGGQSTSPGLAQHAELKEGIIPREYEGVPYEELPPKVKAMWPTPTAGMHKTDVPGDEYAKRHRDRGGQVTLPMEVKLRDEDQEMFPTPKCSDMNRPHLALNEDGVPHDVAKGNLRGVFQDPEMWPTPRTSGGSRPNGKGGKVLSEEVQIAEGVRKRGEYVDGRDERTYVEGETKFPTPTAMDSLPPKSPEAMDETFRRTRGPNRKSMPMNLKESVVYSDLESWPRPEDETFPTQRFPTPCAGTNGRSTYPGRNVVNALLRGEEPTHQPLTVDIVMYEELKERGVKEVVSFKDGTFIMEDGEQVMWPTPSAMDGSRRGKAIDPDHWLEARDKHAAKGVNKHFSLDVAVAFEEQGRDPKEQRDATDEVGEALSPSPVEEMFEGETLWPTPNSSSGLRGGSNVEAARARMIEQGVDPEEVDGMLAKPSERWPTPLASDWKGANLKEGSKSASATGLATVTVKRSRAAFATPTASDAKAGGNDGFSPLGRQLDAAPKKAGLLNPEWVAWLMGWPVGWTSPDPMPEGGLESWLNQNHQRIWWRGEPEGLPRLTQKHETKGSRTARLKALGNGQVSLCCARSYEVLRFTLDEVLNKVKEGEQEVSLDDFFGF
jgi:site-specific DNA-cytosine methylase